MTLVRHQAEKIYRKFAGHQRRYIAVDSRASAFVYFGSKYSFRYQLEEWLPALDHLSREVATHLIFRDLKTYLFFKQTTELPCWLAPDIGSVEELLGQSSKAAVLYVNQDRQNFPVLRNPRPLHILLNHGESDKSFSFTNQVKAYDFVFISGKMGERRLTDHVRFFDPGRAIHVGRPPLAATGTLPPKPSHSVPVVLYAPTWEGDRLSAQYSSLLSHGVALVDHILSSGNFILRFRPHPLLGTRDPAYAKARRHVEKLVRKASSQPGLMNHASHGTQGYRQALSSADHVISDISSVFFDAMALDRDCVYCLPATDGPRLPESGAMTDQRFILPSDSVNSHLSFLDNQSVDERLAARAEWGPEYFPSPDVNDHRNIFVSEVVRLLSRDAGNSSTIWPPGEGNPPAK